MCDIDEGKNKIVSGLASRMLDAAGMHPEMLLTANLNEAVKGADYVLAQVRVGKMEARIRDEKVPQKYGLLGQETTGAGGFMNGLRTIPVLMNIAEAIKQNAPDAWLINFSNPSGLVAEALLNNTDVKMIGLCNIPYKMVKVAKEFSHAGDDFDYDFMGLNHLCWMTGVYTGGRNVLNNFRNLSQIVKYGFFSFIQSDFVLKFFYRKPCINYIKTFFIWWRCEANCKEFVWSIICWICSFSIVPI
jgi:6-phospho-beta-glucosidase